MIVILGAMPPPMNGASRITSEVAARLGDECDVAVANTAVRGRRSLTYHCKRAKAHLRVVLTLFRYRHRDRRVVYVSCPAGFALWYVLPVIAVCRIWGYGVVIHHHSMAYVDRLSLAVWLVARLVGSAGHHVLLSPTMRDRFDGRYSPSRKSGVCSNAGWMEPSIEVARTSTVRNGIRIGHLGTLTEAKGFVELPAVIRQLRDVGVESELWLGGTAPTERDQRALDESLRQVDPHAVRLVGFVDGVEKATFFAEIDVFLLPSRYRHEAEPLVIYEALRAGVPVIAYDIGCVREQLQGTGLLVAPTASFAQAAVPMLKRLTSDPTFRATSCTEAKCAFESAAQAGRDQASALLEELVTDGT